MALIFFGMIWGLVGAFLATPITAVVKIIFERIPVTKPLGDIMAGNLHVLSTGTPADDQLGGQAHDRVSRPPERMTDIAGCPHDDRRT